MIAFKLSAPGKVILFGEHSVVYNKKAVAGSIDLRTTLSFKEDSPDKTFITILMPDAKLNKTVSIDDIKNFFLSHDDIIKLYDLNLEAYIKLIKSFVESIGYESKEQQLCLQALFFIIIAIYQSRDIEEMKPFIIEAKTQLSIGSGLGSSASFAVCLATAFLHYTSILSDKTFDLCEAYLKQVSDYAYNCEKLMHGTPSGIDNTICTYGSLLCFKKDAPSTKFPCHMAIKIMLVDTKVQRSTKTLVGKVRDKKEKYPKIVDPILEAMDNIAEEGVKSIGCIMKSQEESKEYCEEYKKLKNLMEINHGLLNSLGVSHPALDTICTEAKNCGFAAKLTGAGGGGYAFILIPANTSENEIEVLTNKLINHGFGVQLTTIGGKGVEIEDYKSS